MTDVQTRTERTGEACLDYLDSTTPNDNAAIVAADPLLLAKRNKLEAKLGEIHDIELIQETDETGVAVQKNDNKVAVSQLAFVVARRLVSWAKDTNNSTLLNEINFRLTALADVKDSTCLTRCTLIYNRAKALVASPPPAPPTFADYNITAGENADLLALINKFSASLGTPKTAKGVKTASTEDLDHALGEMVVILDDISDSVDTYRFTKKTFWEGWQSSRKRDDTGVRHLRARIFLIDDVTSAKIGQGLVLIPALNLTKKVSKRSLATIKDAEVGIGAFDLLAKANLYLDQPITNVVFEDGKLTRLIVRMKKPPTP